MGEGEGLFVNDFTPIPCPVFLFFRGFGNAIIQNTTQKGLLDFFDYPFIFILFFPSPLNYVIFIRTTYNVFPSNIFYVFGIQDLFS